MGVEVEVDGTGGFAVVGYGKFVGAWEGEVVESVGDVLVMCEDWVYGLTRLEIPRPGRRGFDILSSRADCLSTRP